MKESFEEYMDFIKGEVLATDVTFHECPNGIDVDINGHETLIQIKKVALQSAE